MGEADVVPTPWIYPADEPDPEEALAAPEREEAIEAALDAALELDPAAIRDLYEVLLPPPSVGEGDPTGCPLLLTYDYGTAKAFYWQGECTDSLGTTFSGMGYASWFEKAQFDDGVLADGFDYSLSGRIEAADGTWLEGAGVISSYYAEGPDTHGFGRAIDGVYQAGGPRAPDNVWLTSARRPSLRVDGWTYRPTQGTNLTLTGGLSGLDGFPGGVTAVSFEAFTMRSATAASPCPSEPGGLASIRGPSGAWVDVSFHGLTDEAPKPDPEACDGCGDSFYRGAAAGPTCVDPSSFLDWEGDEPW